MRYGRLEPEPKYFLVGSYISVMSKRVLAFDIGIKNLAWCIMDLSGHEVIDWCNYNIMNDISGTITETDKCQCGAKASWEYQRDGELRVSCKRHLPIDRPAYAGACKSAAELKEFLKSKSQPTKGKKDELRAAALQIVSLPVTKKVTKAGALSLLDIYDGIRKCVRDRDGLMIHGVSNILLENQPAYKNPTMKTIQSFLFAALREASHTANKFPKIELVHASKKVDYDVKGDAGYNERKGNSEQKTLAHLDKTGASSAKWRAMFVGSKKRSDLADAYCMCLEALMR
jgi:hypothetical protein